MQLYYHQLFSAQCDNFGSFVWTNPGIVSRWSDAAVRRGSGEFASVSIPWHVHVHYFITCVFQSALLATLGSAFVLGFLSVGNVLIGHTWPQLPGINDNCTSLSSAQNETVTSSVLLDDFTTFTLHNTTDSL